MEKRQMFGINNREPVNIREFLLMFLLLALSGNPFFTQKLPVLISLLSVISLYYVLTHYNQIIYRRTLFIFIFFIGYELVHAIMFHLDYSVTILKLFLILLFGFVIVNTLKTRFIKVFLQTMYIICIISFVFTILCYIPGVGRGLYKLAGQLFPLQKDFKNYSTPTLIIYTFLPEFFTGEFSYSRNAGIFWESGAFAVFLNVALYLKYFTKKIEGLSDLFDKQSVIYILAIFTAASTMGILSLVLIITFYCFQFKSNLKYFGVLLIIMVAMLAFFSFDFLGNKIEQQLSVSGTSNNRFGSALLDFKDIAQRPLFGWSRRIEVLFKTDIYSARSHRPNGLTNFLRNYGLIYFAVYFYLVYLSFERIGRYYKTNKVSLALMGILVLWIVSFSELIFDFAFFKSLLFLSMIYDPAGKSKVSASLLADRELTLNS